jgi:hypothetical protein
VLTPNDSLVQTILLLQDFATRDPQLSNVEQKKTGNIGKFKLRAGIPSKLCGRKELR